MKKSVLFSTIILILFSSISFAAFTSVTISTLTAIVSFNVNGEVLVSVEMKTVIGDNTTTQIYWDTSDISPGVTQWHIADSYILLHSTISQSGGGIQIYTDNKASDADPAYTGANNTNPAGLISEEVPNETPLAMCWRMVDASTTTDVLDIVQVNSQGTWSDPGQPHDGETITKSTLYSPSLGTNYPCYFFMKDKSTPKIWYENTTAFKNADEYIVVKDQAFGIHHAEGNNWGTTASPDCIYIGANFKEASAPRTYQTKTLRIEAFSE
jgi:hypothetical protein